MWTELALRFCFGGILVSLFALLGQVLRPKTFSGIFGAAPSVALAALGICFWKDGAAGAAIEGRSMLIASAALLTYSAICVYIAKTKRLPVWFGAGLAWLAWLAVALGGWCLYTRIAR
jgi:hypothetical protein